MLDPDIAAATSSLDLEKIRAQSYRDSLMAQKDYQLRMSQAVTNMVNWAQMNYAEMGVNETLAFHRELAIGIAAKYLTTSTATTDAAILADAQADSKRAKAAFDEFVKLFALS